MNAFKVTHLDHAQRRRQFILECANRKAAEALAEAMYGVARYLAAVRLRGVRP